MAKGAVVNQGKRAFVEKYFGSNPGGNLESVNKAWTAAGNEGTVSESLVGKVRSSLGLTGKKTAEAPKSVEAAAKAKAKPRAKSKKVAKPVEQAPPCPTGLMLRRWPLPPLITTMMRTFWTSWRRASTN